MDDDRENRAVGCLVALACGDALGAPFEGGPPLEEAPGDFIEGNGRPAGHWTDDTQLALATAESVIEEGGFHPDKVIHKFAGMLEDIRGIGRTTSLVLEAVRDGVPWKEAARKAHEATGGLSAGNGAVMRAAPIAIRYWNARTSLRQASIFQAAIIHQDPEAHDAAWLFNSLLAVLIRGVVDRDEALGEVEVEFLGNHRRMAGILREVASLRRSELPPAGGYVVNTLVNAIWCFFQMDTLEEAVSGAVALGLDTDTTAAVTGALAGAFHGLKAVPEKWLYSLEEADRIRSAASVLYRASLEQPR